MVTPAPTACARSATRKTCRDNREGGDPAPQERKVGRWERHDLKKAVKGAEYGSVRWGRQELGMGGT